MGITSVTLSGKEYVIAEVKFFISSTSLVSAVNHMAAQAFREEKKTESFFFFFYLNFNVYNSLKLKESTYTSRCHAFVQEVCYRLLT